MSNEMKYRITLGAAAMPERAAGDALVCIELRTPTPEQMKEIMTKTKGSPIDPASYRDVRMMGFDAREQLANGSPSGMTPNDVLGCLIAAFGLLEDKFPSGDFRQAYCAAAIQNWFVVCEAAGMLEDFKGALHKKPGQVH